MLTVLVVRGATLNGALQGITYFFSPSWQQLARPEVSPLALLRCTLFLTLLLPAEATAVLFSAWSELCEHDNSWTAALSLSLIKFCMNMYLDNL